MKRVPSFWYDYSAPATMPIIVESDDQKYPVIARFYDSPDRAMRAAWNLIQDLKAGRVDYRRLARKEAKKVA